MEQTVARNSNTQAEQTRVDFKMVTFTIGGKDYGIDIMKVKEISKASKFTFVPNASPFVRGVYNLRGDIISVIDLRIFFNLPVAEKRDSDFVNMIILRLEGHVLAIIVDTIDKVVGISSENVQPPHPLFGDINIKYISGVVEDAGRLYVILDVERIFGSEDTVENGRTTERPQIQSSTAAENIPLNSTVNSTAKAVKEDVDIGFIEETLITFLNFNSSPVNQDWVRNRYSSWKKQRSDEVQLASVQDAESYLAPFWSPFSGTYWSPDYVEKVASFLPTGHKGNFHVWNPGCGSGHESYSLACMVKSVLPGVQLRVIAHDNDLIRISTAPGLIVDKSPGSPYEPYLVEGKRGSGFNKEIRDSILFEYHDITHDNTLPKLDLVVIRDTLSFIVPERQAYIFGILDEMMKRGGLLLLGDHEVPMNPDAWQKIDNAGVVAYKKK